jgi:Soluble lytic murein transglycosylase and related regulatory proteins (some contain LysM/invasin domains)
MSNNSDKFIKSNTRIILGAFLSIFAFYIAFLPTDHVHADIFKYVDKEGVLHLTNVPSIPNAKYVLILKEKRILFRSDIDISKFDQIIISAADKYKIDSALIKAVIKAESNFNHQAVSPVGAQGLMQLMPATASQLQVEDAFHPGKNIEGGTRYLRYLLNVYHGNLTLALAAYNAGEGAVAKYNNRIPPYRETQNYVKRVLSFYKTFSK